MVTVTDRPGLLQYLKRETRYDMHDAAQAHQAVLAVGGTHEIFEMSAQYGASVASSKVVVQGVPMWPELSVLAFGSLPQPQYEVANLPFDHPCSTRVLERICRSYFGFSCSLLFCIGLCLNAFSAMNGCCTHAITQVIVTPLLRWRSVCAVVLNKCSE